jgi:large subunit ribosomal protein L25
MKSIAINAELRNGNSKSDAVNLRRNQRVPAIIYGGESNILVSFDEKEINKFIYTPEIIIAEIHVDGKVIKGLIQDKQFDPVTDKTVHIDILELVPGKPVKTSLPIRLVGNSSGVRAGGKLKMVLRRLKVKGLAEALPDFIEVDITEVGIGQSVRVKSLNIPGVEILEIPEGVIASVAATRNSMKEEAAAAAASAKKK